MYSEDESKWINQTLMIYKDDKYASDGFLRVSIFTNTRDYKFYNPPKFGISISNQKFQKSYNLDIIGASDLFKSLTYAFKNSDKIFEDKSQIVKQDRTIQLIIDFTVAQNDDYVVRVTIKSGETDTTNILIPADVFQLFANILKFYVDKYCQLCSDLFIKAVDGELITLLQQLPTLIKQMPSQILPANYIDSSAPPEEAIKKTEINITNFEEMLGPNMENIKVAELAEKKDEPIVEVESLFVDKFIKGDLRNLETILNNTSSIEELSHKMKLDMGLGEEISMMPGITDDEMISLLYVSKLLVNTIELSWTKFESPIPSSTPILRYEAKDNVKPENIELAYDLLLMSGYIRSVRRRLEDKIADANENKSLFHLKFRCYVDPFYFSFLEKSDKTKLTSIIVNRFRYFNSLGVFDEYKNTLTMHNCADITEQDIAVYINEVGEKVIGKSLFILDQHDKLMVENNFKIGSKSNFNKEQIINEIVPLEIAEKVGQDTSSIEVSDEVKSFFKSKRKVKKVTEKSKKNHLARVVGTLKSDIPDKYKEDFLKWVEELDSKNFVFDKKFPYQEFGDDLIKALYVWKPEDDPRIGSSLKYYQTKIESEVMEKEYILAMGDVKEEKTPGIDFGDINWE